VARAVPCVDTPTGPLIGSHRGLLCAYKIGGYRDFGAMAQLVEMARARDLPEFQSALAMQQMPCFHVLYADRGGNISYLYNVKVGNKAGFELPPPNPRKRGENDANDEPETPPALLEWNLPVPAGRPVFRWGDIVPAEMLPGVTNPKSGYLQACGTPPWAVTDDCAIKQENLPRWFAWDRDTFRAQRVRKLLAMGKRSFRDCQSMLYDVAAPFAMEAVPVLVKTAESRKDALAALHPDLPLMIDTLKTWNYTAENNSTGMTLFHAWWSAMRGQDLTAFGNEEGLYAALRDNAPEAQDLALNAAADAARLMRNDFQTLTVPWGEVHTIRRGAKEVAVAGAASGEPIFTESDYVYEGRKWHATYGYAFAMVVSFGAKTTAVSMTPFGASESAASPHYADQLDLLTERRLKVTRFRPEEIQRYASSARGRVLYLRPRGCEALVTLNTPAVVEARLVSFPEAAEKLPDGLVPFTLFMGLEQAPADTPAEARLEVFVPPVLCAGENLKELGLYGCTAGQQWTRLESQELNEEARTLSGHDARTFTKFVVLGPQQFLAQRLVIPGQKTSAQPPSPFTTPIEAKAPVIPMPPRAPEQPAPESNPVVITNTPQDGEPGTKLQGEKKPVVITNVPGAGGAQGGKTSVIITNIPDGDKAAGPTGIRKITPGTPPKENDTRQGVLVPSQKEAQEPGVGQMRQTPTMDGQPLPEIEFLPQPEPEKAQPDKKQKPKKEPFFSKFGHKKKKSGPAAKRNYGINKKKASN
jgi:hypothetical protein